MSSIEKEIAKSLLQIKAIKLNPASPFTWASGWNSPIYCDNRKTLSYPAVRKQVYEAFAQVISEKYPQADIIAGVATGAIAHGVLAAEAMGKPFIYVRSAPKSHGMTNQVEGEYTPGAKVVVIEDLVSTGGSSLNAVEALRDAGCEVLGMVAIFTYGFPKAEENFAQNNV
ncbi:orotate phosphoribosyltransferase, partial [Alistipes sp. OttesenSCG-928-L06]|nr:orotate phosphoribosyltransferase [Alistipes sp. OttesenSCG-928-L06]